MLVLNLDPRFNARYLIRSKDALDASRGDPRGDSATAAKKLQDLFRGVTPSLVGGAGSSLALVPRTKAPLLSYLLGGAIRLERRKHLMAESIRFPPICPPPMGSNMFPLVPTE